MSANSGLCDAGPPAWKTIPSWAVIGTADQVIPPAELTFMAQRAGAHIADVNAGHLSLISRANVVTRASSSRPSRPPDDPQPAWCPANPAPGSRDTGRLTRR